MPRKTRIRMVTKTEARDVAERAEELRELKAELHLQWRERDLVQTLTGRESKDRAA